MSPEFHLTPPCSTDRDLLETQGSFIIRQLCVLLNPEMIYRALAGILLQEDDLDFAGLMVQVRSLGAA